MDGTLIDSLGWDYDGLGIAKEFNFYEKRVLYYKVGASITYWFLFYDHL